jgi:hypothetical protein
VMVDAKDAEVLLRTRLFTRAISHHISHPISPGAIQSDGL